MSGAGERLALPQIVKLLYAGKKRLLILRSVRSGGFQLAVLFEASAALALKQNGGGMLWFLLPSLEGDVLGGWKPMQLFHVEHRTSVFPRGPRLEAVRELKPIVVTVKGPGTFYEGDRRFDVMTTGDPGISALLTRGWDTLEFPGHISFDGHRRHVQSGIVLWCRHVAPNESILDQLSGEPLEVIPPGFFVQAAPREPGYGEAVVAFQRTTFQLHRCSDGDTCPMLGDCRSSGRCAVSTPANPIFGPWMYRCDYEEILRRVPDLTSAIPRDYDFPVPLVPGYRVTM